MGGYVELLKIYEAKLSSVPSVSKSIQNV
uniref:Uncharacterized protein n=1 Tax=Anguilla anguilla TaxID=7936 RepID=A0A0E9SXI4_ANGAN